MHCLFVIDYQKDFVDGALGFPGAEKLDAAIAARVAEGTEMEFCRENIAIEWPGDDRKIQVPTASQVYAEGMTLDLGGLTARLLPVESSSSGPLDKALDLLPELMTKISAMIDQKKAEKAEKAEKKAAESGQGDPTKEK